MISIGYLQKMKEGPGGKGKGGEDKMKPEGSGGKNKDDQDKLKPEGSGRKDGSGGRKPGLAKNKVEEDLTRALNDFEIYAASEEALEERVRS